MFAYILSVVGGVLIAFVARSGSKMKKQTLYQFSLQQELLFSAYFSNANFKSEITI